MEAKIGVVHTARELTVELDGDADEVRALVEQALSGGAPMLWITDRRGRRVGVPSDKIAYVECSDDDTRRVGFSRA
jgi:hypothetical protein